MLYDYSFINQSKIVISEVVIPTNHQSEVLQERTDPLTFILSRKLCSTPVDMNAGLQNNEQECNFVYEVFQPFND